LAREVANVFKFAVTHHEVASCQVAFETYAQEVMVHELEN
jgi:hypothetical protein